MTFGPDIKKIPVSAAFSNFVHNAAAETWLFILIIINGKRNYTSCLYRPKLFDISQTFFYLRALAKLEAPTAYELLILQANSTVTAAHSLYLQRICKLHVLSSPGWLVSGKSNSCLAGAPQQQSL